MNNYTELDFLNLTADLPANTSITDVWEQGGLFKWHKTQMIFIPLLMTLGIIGNLLVLYIYHFRLPDSKAAHFKKMLALLDLSSLITAAPTLMYLTVNSDSKYYNQICVFSSFCSLSAANASACFLVVIAIDRYMKLCLLRKTGIEYSMSKKLFFASISLGCLMNIPCGWTFGHVVIDVHKYNIHIDECYISSDEALTLIFLTHATMLIALFFIVSVTMFYLYFKIVVTLRALSAKSIELQKKLYSLPEDTQNRTKQNDPMKSSAIVFILITLVFFVSYTPYFVVLMLTMAGMIRTSDVSPGVKAVYDLAKLSLMLDDTANPFIYSFTYGGFIQEVKKMLTLDIYPSESSLDNNYDLSTVVGEVEPKQESDEQIQELTEETKPDMN